MSKSRVTIIAEVGSVHDGSFGNAQKLIEAGAAAGADVVKFQTHLAEYETLKSAPNPSYFQAEPRYEYFQRTGFTRDQWSALKQHCEKNGIGFLSSPFSLEAVDLLESLGVESFKVPSGEVTNLPLLHRLAKTGKTIYLSSGMSDWKELDTAVAALKKGSGKVVLFQCSSAYPCKPSAVGINVIPEMKKRYDVEVGFSDHTLGSAASIAAVVVGATVIEKHFTFSKLMYGSDAKHSMDPIEFSSFCASLREVAEIVANPVDKSDTSPYKDMKKIFEKSIVTNAGLKKGTTLSLKDISFKKPGTGISASRYESFIGKRLKKDVEKDTLLSEGDFE